MARRREQGGAAADAQWDALVQAWLGAMSSPNTRSAYGRDVATFAAWCRAQGLSPLHATRADVDEFRRSDGDAGPATVARRLSALSSFYRFAVGEHVLERNPVERVDRPAHPGPGGRAALDDDEAGALYDAARSLGPKVTVLVGLLLLNGMKLGEALALDADDVHGTSRAMSATVRRRGQLHEVPLERRTSTAVTRYLEGRAEGPLLVGDSPTRSSGQRLTRFGADFLLKRATERAGIEGSVSANTLRRTFIARAHRAGVPVPDIQRQVGHADPRDTRRYL